MSRRVPTKYALERVSAWAEAATGLTARAPGAPLMRPDLPYVGVSYQPGWSWDGAHVEERRYTAAPVAWILDVAAATGVDPIAVEVAGETAQIGPGLTGTTARNALLEALQALRLESDGWVALAAAGATQVTVATGAGWGPPAVIARQQITVTPTATEACSVTRTSVLGVLRVIFYGLDTFDAAAAPAALRRSHARGDAPPFVRAVRAPAVQPIRSGPDPDYRAWVDLDVGLWEADRRASPGLAGVAVTLGQG